MKRGLVLALGLTVVGLAAGAWFGTYRTRCARREAERVEFERFLMELEREDPKGPAPLNRRFDADLSASLDETLRVMQEGMGRFWLESEKIVARCRRVVDGRGEAGAEACLAALERRDSDRDEAALTCLFGNPILANLDAARIRRAVEPYADASGTPGPDARAILDSVGRR
jgi:hypothetical protein